jgi:hypothetical protein
MSKRAVLVQVVAVVLLIAPGALGDDRDTPSIVVLSQKQRLRWVWIPPGSPESSDRHSTRQRNATPSIHEDATKETTVVERQGSLKALRTYEAEVRNIGTRDVEGVGWRYEYGYTDADTPRDRYAESFATKVKIRPGGRTRLRGEVAGVGARGTVTRERNEIKLVKPAWERVIITVILYADGTRWEGE